MKALIVIDIQNDYFESGAFPLANAEATLNSIMKAVEAAQKHGYPVIVVQHVANPAAGPSPFFNSGTVGVEVHPRLAAVQGTELVVKEYSDSFHKTTLGAVLAKHHVEEILVCGMMTQNCVVHTAISTEAAKFKVKVLSDCCTSQSEIIHMIGLHGMSHRVELVGHEQALK